MNCACMRATAACGLTETSLQGQESCCSPGFRDVTAGLEGQSERARARELVNVRTQAENHLTSPLDISSALGSASFCLSDRLRSVIATCRVPRPFALGSLESRGSNCTFIISTEVFVSVVT